MWSATKNKKYGVATCSYNGRTKYGLRVDLGETVHILEECNGWFRGYVIRNKAVKGLFPACYITLKSFHIDNEGQYETVSPVEDATVQEVAYVLRELSKIWRQLYIVRDVKTFQMLRQVMLTLIDWRKQLLAGNLTQDQTRDLKLKITSKIDWANRKLGLDLIPRIDSERIDPEKISVIDLYNVHTESVHTSGNTSNRGTLRRPEKMKALNHHIYFCLRDFSFAIFEDTEIYFSLYDAKNTKFISERFLVKKSKDGFLNFEKLQSHCAVFTDLGSFDLSRDLYIVTHIMRIGRMQLNESSRKSLSHQYRRPHGCAVLSIADVVQDKNSSCEEKEFTLKAYQCNENDFYQLHEFIIRKQTNKYNLLSGQPNYGFMVSIKVLHGDLEDVRKENLLLFKSAAITHKCGFSDVIMPSDIRNDFYLALEMAEFEKGGKNTGKNVEASIIVVDQDGVVFLDCICIGSGHQPVKEYHSYIMYHNNIPHWAEMIKLVIPIEKFHGAHFRIEFKHCSTRDKSEKLFAFSFVRLMDEEGILTDGSHDLFVYKCEDKQKLGNPKTYLGLPSVIPCGGGNPVPIANQFYQRSTKEFVRISTSLCSTKLTQNVDLQSLLKWKSHPENIEVTLSRFMKLNGEEIVKFLQDVLDQLFSMFSTTDGNSTTHSGLVFQVLVHTFCLLRDSKFEHFKPVLDKYITDHFAAALVYKGLLISLQYCADYVIATSKAPEMQEQLQKCFQSLEHIFKFITQSRMLFSRATGGQNEDSFKMDLYLLFSSFNKMLSISCPAITSSQVALIYNFSFIYDELLKVLPEQELAKVIKMLIDSIPRDPPIILIQAKIRCLKETVKSRIFTNPESRLLLIEMCTRHLRFHMIQRQDVRLCGEVLGEILILLHKQHQTTLQDDHNYVAIHHDIEVVALSLLDPLIQIVLKTEHSGDVTGQLIACLIGLLRLMNENHYRRLWDEFGEKKPLKEFLSRVFQVFNDLVKLDIFPKDWMTLKLVTNNVILGSLQEFSQLLNIDFLDGVSFDHQIWSQYFNLAVFFLTQPCLQLENFSDTKREKIIERYSDMRVLMGFQILSMWSNLGEHKVNFIPAMVGPFLEVTLVPETELRKATLPIFFDMIDCEQKHRGSFRQVESELIDKLDILVSENKGDDEYRQLFNTILLERVKQNDPIWKDNGTVFINSVTLLLERLLDYRNVMKGDENKDKRMSCTVNLLNFYKSEINRQEMYIRYIYKLCDLHLSSDNYTEAAFTLKLHADLLSWGNRALHANLRYPAQLEWQRREMIYLKIVEYFDRGKCWEKGIPFCKELADFYEKKRYDYSKLSSILQTEAKFFENILSMLRPQPEYFRVGFYGMCFPLFVRNKVFIYRGIEYERIEAFTQRLQTEFPNAQALMKITPPDDSIRNSDSQFIQICNVKPVPEEFTDFQGQDIPDKILDFYLFNDVSKFQLNRPIHKGVVDKNNEFKNLWIERTTLVTSESLPGILRWFEVVQKDVEELSPIQVACESVDKMNKELRHLIAQYTADSGRTINPLSMRLQGVIDSAVNGGIAKYQQAFFVGDFALSHPEYKEYIGILKAHIMEQVQILEGGLSLHGRLAPSEVRPLHDMLVERFSTMKHEIKDSGSPNMRLSISSIVSSTSSSTSSSSCVSGSSTKNSGGARKSEQHDTGEYRKPASIINQPLPPLPSVGHRNNKPLPTKLPTDPHHHHHHHHHQHHHNCSNRSSSASGGSSSMYGHFIRDVSEDEELTYDKPCMRHNGDDKSGNTARPHSIGSTDSKITIRLPNRTLSDAQFSVNQHIYKQPCTEDKSNVVKRSRSQTTSPRLPSKHPHHQTVDESDKCAKSDENVNRDSTAPPLPPRLSIERKADKKPPLLPERSFRKNSAPFLDDDQQSGLQNLPQPPKGSAPPLPLKRNTLLSRQLSSPNQTSTAPSQSITRPASSPVEKSSPNTPQQNKPLSPSKDSPTPPPRPDSCTSSSASS